MVFTLGFLSILAFAGILAAAGFVVAAIVDDALARFHLEVLTRPGPALLMWGSFYYSWMILIASVTHKWKSVRLGEPLPMADSYWFAYISTTTVGLGDIYLEPEVIISSDLVLFPLLFLIGFTLASAFLAKLSELVMAIVPDGRKDFLTSLVDRLQKTNVVGDVPELPEMPELPAGVTNLMHMPGHVEKEDTHDAKDST